MPILSEQERLVSQELNLINDATQYAATTNAWVLLKDWGNITLPIAGILLIKFESALDVAGGTGGVRIKVGSYYVCVSFTNTATWQTFGTAVWLAAGTYDVKVEGWLNGAGSNFNVYIKNFQAGLCSFNDAIGSALGTYNSGIALTVANRNTPVGPLKQTTYFVQVYAVTAGASTPLENIGDNFTNGVSILVDGAQVNWSERISELSGSIGGTSGKVALPYNVGGSHTVTISKRNGSTAVTISIIACPWILPASTNPSSPVTLNFSQASTLYCMLEPLYMNPTKLAGVGVIHGITFGTADDYYSSGTGPDLINFSYMMDIVDVSKNNLTVYGLGGCIGIIGVDAR